MAEPTRPPEAAPVLFFDSGVGGLSILRPAMALLPTMPIVYAADNAGFPYGIKSEAEIAARVPALLGRLVERYRPRMAVIACNTASTIALASVRAALDIPVVGTVPAIKPAALASKTRVIGVLGTDATVRQPYVDRLAREHGADCTVLRHGSAALVAYAEARLRGAPADPEIPATALAGLLEQPGGNRMDMVVLACTHFPLVEAELAEAAPRPITFLHGGDGIARRIAWLNGEVPWPAEPAPGKAVFTGPSSDIEALSPALRTYGITKTELL
ncbi:glutamate racemase [Sphingobium sp. B2D3A]|uniref:glutamate racemase n=1 Tax=unclassified Sphingobium TaxID=2611147 RepID=UPI00222521BE|nr:MULTISPECIES: glutamate racemase [unclassified Sphingobium]MCW2338129.1 glutamate racemase [Sphingobium sp. B2D3A]MCW2384588.1 glutamate racemase [Sphingobium sp. B2D3D]